jgi:hypothetical protein
MRNIASIGAALASIAGIPMRGVKLPKHARSKYMPHIGKKEQERAKRCYMSKYHSGGCGYLRSAPTLCQDSRRTFETPF